MTSHSFRALVLLLALAFANDTSAGQLQQKLGLSLFKKGVEKRLQQGAWIKSLPDGLHAGLCGSGSPLADPTRAGPCVFVIAGKRVFVVDAGEGSPRKLTLMGLSPGLIDSIFLTHFHSDHIGGLGEMMFQRWAGALHKSPVPVIGPQGVESVVQGFNQAYALDANYRVTHHGDATMPASGAGGVAHPFAMTPGSPQGQIVLQEDGLTVTAFPVDHGPVFPATGYRFDYRGRSLVLSGDTAPSPVLAKYAQGVDVLFHEGLQTSMVSLVEDAALKNNQPRIAKILSDIPSYHTTPENAARIAQKAGVHYLMFYHTIPPLPERILNAAFLGDAPSIYKGPITVGRDGMLLSLPAGSAAISLKELL